MRRIFALAIVVLLTSACASATVAAKPDPCRRPNHPHCVTPTPTPQATPIPTVAPPTPIATVAPTPVVTPPPATPAPTPGSRWSLLFHDDFDWTAAEGEFLTVGGDRWSAYPYPWKDTSGNGTYTPRIISVHDGVMDIHLRHENGEYLVANPGPRINGPDQDRYQLYGRYEIRFRADPVDGYKTAWLLWPNDGEGGGGEWPRDGEIDFPEGNLDGTICAFMHRQGATSGSDQDAFCTSTTYVDWHTAVIEWEPTRVGFYLDGVLIGESTSRIPNTEMRWQIQTETEIRSTPPATSAQSHVLIDYVTVWSYTP